MEVGVANRTQVPISLHNLGSQLQLTQQLILLSSDTQEWIRRTTVAATRIIMVQEATTILINRQVVQHLLELFDRHSLGSQPQHRTILETPSPLSISSGHLLLPEIIPIQLQFLNLELQPFLPIPRTNKHQLKTTQGNLNKIRISSSHRRHKLLPPAIISSRCLLAFRTQILSSSSRVTLKWAEWVQALLPIIMLRSRTLPPQAHHSLGLVESPIQVKVAIMPHLKSITLNLMVRIPRLNKIKIHHPLNKITKLQVIMQPHRGLQAWTNFVHSHQLFSFQIPNSSKIKISSRLKKITKVRLIAELQLHLGLTIILSILQDNSHHKPKVLQLI